MNIKYFITILALTSGFLSHAKKEKSSSKIPELGALKEERDYTSYSGCYVKNAKGEDIFIDLVPVGKPMIRINGEVIRGSVEDPSKSLNRYSEMG